MMRLFKLLVLLIIMSSCYTNKLFDFTKKYAVSHEMPKNEPYVISVSDELNIQMFTNEGLPLFQERTMSLGSTKTNILQYLVKQNGMVELPVIGDIKAQGLTINEFTEVLKEKFSKLYVKPYIKVIVTNRKILILTRSKGTLVYPLLQNNVTLAEIIAESGGIDLYMKSNKITVYRKNKQGKRDIYVFDFSKIENINKSDMIMQAGDIVKIDYSKSFDSIERITPFLGFISSVFLVANVILGFL